MNLIMGTDYLTLPIIFESQSILYLSIKSNSFKQHYFFHEFHHHEKTTLFCPLGIMNLNKTLYIYILHILVYNKLLFFFFVTSQFFLVLFLFKLIKEQMCVTHTVKPWFTSYVHCILITLHNTMTKRNILTLKMHFSCHV